MNKLIFTLLLLMAASASFSQDIDSLANSMLDDDISYATAVFKSTRIVNLQSIEQVKAGQLDVRIHHRFGTLNGGAYQLWGMDQSTVFLGLDYGLTDWMTLGVGRSSYEKTYNGYFKASILRQSTGKKRMPVSLSVYAGSDVFTTEWSDPSRTNHLSSRFSYIFQILVARKFNETFSLQFSPTLVHRNLVATALDQNDMFAFGFGGRLKLTHRLSLNAEYIWVLHPPIQGKTYNPNSLSFGVDIETGGHVFQLFLTNSLPMFERGFITETTDKWSKGGIHFGFNISRMFTLRSYAKE